MDMSLLPYQEHIGKHITVNCMMAKDSVKRRLEGDSGLSFTEFSLPADTGLRFLLLMETPQLSCADGRFRSVGNIVTGIELHQKKRRRYSFCNYHDNSLKKRWY